MKVNANMHIECVPMEELRTCHKLSEVLGYCTQCSNYRSNHSCPDFDFEVEALLDTYAHAVIIMTRIDTGEIRAQLDLLKKRSFDSAVYDRYASDLETADGGWKTKLSMYVFEAVKDQMTEKLLAVERQVPESLSLPPGACTRCKTCLKTRGLPCTEPNKLRYSLEALGFLVSDIYHKIYGFELQWSANDIPESFDTCSALLVKTPLETDYINALIGEVYIEL